MALSVVRNLSLADQVFQQLASAILSSGYAPGSYLPAERKLVENFKVNRHVVREALKRLEQIGVVKITQGGGTQVLDFTRHAGLDMLALMADFSNAREETLGVWLAVQEMQVVVAADAARLCTLRAPPELKQEILATTHQMRDAKDDVTLHDLDVEFWDRVIDGSANIAYRLAFNSMLKGTHAPEVRDVARVWAIFELRQSGFRVPIAEAIVQGDAVTAEQKVRESMRVMAEALARVAPSPKPFRRTASSTDQAPPPPLEITSIPRRAKKRAEPVDPT
jgi:GntR family transcriptional regulator, transcriptional repressor for pyruvate dehydrogenase complex